MAIVLALVWGEDNVPADTWLKAHVAALYATRARHKQARQKMEHQAD